MNASTSERLLDAAEFLFAERGFDATAVREITRRANANLASVNYHFGSKNELLDAVFKRRLDPINQERIFELQRLVHEYQPDIPPLESLLRTFLAPPFRVLQQMGADGAAFLRLLMRVHLETNSEFTLRFRAQFEQILSRFVPLFQQALPHLNTSLLNQRLFFAIGSMSHAVTWILNAQVLAKQHADPHSVLEELITFTAAGLRAPIAFGGNIHEA